MSVNNTNKAASVAVITESIKSNNKLLLESINDLIGPVIESNKSMMVEIHALSSEIANLKLMVQQLQSCVDKQKPVKAPKQPAADTIKSTVVVKNKPSVPKQAVTYFKNKYMTDPEYQEKINETNKDLIDEINKTLSQTEKDKGTVLPAKIWNKWTSIKPMPKDKCDIIEEHSNLLKSPDSDKNLDEEEIN